MAKPEWRDLEKERLWRIRMQAWRESGLDGRAFCRREELSLPSFYAWRRELAQRDREAVAAAGGAVDAGSPSGDGSIASAQSPGAESSRRLRRRTKPAMRFVSLAVEPGSGAASAVEIVLPGGVLLRVRPSVTRCTLREVLAALAEANAAQAMSPEARRC